MNSTESQSSRSFFSPKRDSRGRRSKGFNLIVAIIVALCLWVYVIGEVNPTTTDTYHDVPVQLLNQESLLNRGLAIIGDVDYRVNVIVEGKRGDLMNLEVANIEATADLFGYGRGENYVMVNVTLPDSLKSLVLLEVRSARIQVNIDELVSVSMPVTVVLSGEVPPGKELSGVAVKPEEVEVSGAKSIVGTIARLEARVAIDNISSAGSVIETEIVPVTDTEMLVENVKLSSSYADYYAQMCDLKTVALEVSMTGTMPEGLGAEIEGPAAITVRGAPEVLEDLESVAAEPVDTSRMPVGISQYPLKLVLPEGVSLADSQGQSYARVVVKDIQTVSYTYNAGDILLENVTAHQDVTVMDQEITLTITGEKRVMEGLTEADFRLAIDLSGVAPGEYAAPLNVLYTADLISVTSDPESIEIVVEDK